MLRREALELLAAAACAVGRAEDESATAVLLDVRTRRQIAARGGAAAERVLLPPGSTLKPLVLSALLKLGKLTDRETFPCPGALTIAGRQFNCSHPPIGAPMRVETALAYSCNCFVAHMAERFEPGELARELEASGLAAGEGRITPTRTPDAIRLQALGEAGVLVSVSDLANAYRLLALHAAPAILAGMEGAVEYGTAQYARVDGVQVAGKTGSARTTGGERIAWFAGFMPSRNPEVAIAVALQGQSGGSDAAPVARRMLEEYRAGAPKGQAVRVRSSDGKILELPIERYVAGVVTGESSVFQSAEALKAMAVAARTYAVKMRGRHSAEGYDFCVTTHCQRMEPGPPAARAEKATADTAGELLWYDGKPALTPYTRDCGGRTEDAAAIWPEMAAPYLKVQNDPHCATPPWQWSGDPRRIAEALAHAQLHAPRLVEEIAIVERTGSGRARTLALSGASESVRISAGSFRFALGREIGWNTVLSDRYEVRGVIFQGRGSGHGVGLCQAGADRMGVEGKSYREILAFYYPGTRAGTAAQGIPWQRLGGETIALMTTRPSEDGLVLALAERVLRESAQRTNWPAPRNLEIYLYPDLDSFRNATGEPGWVAAHTAGARIHLQPAAILRSRGALESTLRHELLHVLVESQARADLPLWFREGLVEYLADPPPTSGPARTPAEADFRQTGDAARARQAYQDAARMVADLARRYGDAAVLEWVRRGVPAEVTNGK